MKREPKRNRCNLQYRSWNGLDHSAAIGKVLGPDVQIAHFSEEEAEKEIESIFCYFYNHSLKNIRPQTPMIHLTNLFNDTWLRNEWQRAKEIRSVESQNIHMTYQLLENTQGYRANIQKMIADLEAEKLVDPQFIERIFTREINKQLFLNRGLPFPIQLIKPYQRLFYRLGF